MRHRTVLDSALMRSGVFFFSIVFQFSKGVLLKQHEKMDCTMSDSDDTFLSQDLDSCKYSGSQNVDEEDIILSRDIL